MSRKTICLNMIVKNESKIITRLFDSVINIIDTYVICDTGSNDNTVEIIKEYFTNKNILGEIIYEPFQNFGYNRTFALQHAKNKADYILLLDADMKVVVNKNFNKNTLSADVYKILQIDSHLKYYNIRLIKSNIDIKCLGVTHEYYDTNKSNQILDNMYIDDIGDGGCKDNKYERDIKLLLKGISDEPNNSRYFFYLSQSYKDIGNITKAIEWYSKTLELNGWIQEKYYSCLMLGDLYNTQKDSEKALKYWLKTIEYDSDRIDGIVKACEWAYNTKNYCLVNVLYHKFKNYKKDLKNKLFIFYHLYNYHLEYYNSIASFYVNDKESGYECCKQIILNNGYNVRNAFSNFVFYVDYLEKDKHNINLIYKLKDYIKNKEYSYADRIKLWDHIQNYLKKKHKKIWKEISNEITRDHIIKKEEYSSSNKILIYTGLMFFPWNDTYMENNSLGGSEKAVVYLSRNLPKHYDIYISGNVIDEIKDNITYIHHDKLQNLLDKEVFHTIIVSRYIYFFIKYFNVKCHQMILSTHDTEYINFVYKNISTDNILRQSYKHIDYVITLTKWHKNLISQKYKYIEDKINIINNGIDITNFPKRKEKIKNKFIWSSCTERGLNILLDLWEKILEKLPDATLDICGYNEFPRNKEEEKMLKIINKHSSIIHHGKLNIKHLYDLMNISEYWLYTTIFTETSCITGMEMLMSKVICIYYPLAGLVDTVGNYGLQVKQGNEIETILHLTDEKKDKMRKKGREYALKCSWENRSKKWINLLGLNKKNWIFYCSDDYEKKMINKYINNLICIYNEYNIFLTSNKNDIKTIKPEYITFIYEIFDNSIFSELPNSSFSFLNTEPLNISHRLQPILNIIKSYPKIKYYDYSKSNLKILEENNISIQDKIYLPYICCNEELDNLKFLNKNIKKDFDFGIIQSSGGNTEDRRLKVIDFLKKNNFSVNIIGGWGEDRDMELAKCKIILNVHGFSRVPSTIFEHIRCNRLLEADFNILSETSYKLDETFTNKYPNLKQISYNDFLNIDIINKVIYDSKPKKIIDCFIFFNELDLLKYRLNILDDVVDYFVLVESTHTHIGKEKPLFYNENKNMFEKFNHKIIHVIVDDFPYKYPNINIEKDEQWTNERFQRDCISRG